MAKLNWLKNQGGIAKANLPQHARAVGLKGPQSRILYLKPVDLALGKPKRAERPVEG